ncbi:SRPBCC family protein [Antrihabitans sp. YC3-6]|uniref:SRPBCC family protein n=1 Tax=Antrihabitans stalagmiti TaxID=2799499 RepID=A0A934U5F2_9NOCA|nr:SRPBCC family protein [Antrihabitans stalagmiti]MBJ8341401.1 SRPBCC family protein [Antrihabitans stalagmiti]
MVEAQRTFMVAKPLKTVVAYLRDFGHATEWDPGSKKCSQISDGPVAVGTQWRNVSSFFGMETELTYQLTRDEPNHLVFEGSNKTASSVDDLTFATVDDDSTEITYQAHIEFNGVAKLADPVVGLGFPGLADKTVEQMTRTLEAL